MSGYVIAALVMAGFALGTMSGHAIGYARAVRNAPRYRRVGSSK